MAEDRILDKNAVVAEELSKKYPHVTAVDNITFSVHEGEIWGFLGPNGAGKTTTIRMLLTLIKPSVGRIHVFGVDALSRPEQVRRMAGYVPQEVSVDGDLTGYENILMYSKLYGVQKEKRQNRISEVLEYLELQDRADDMVRTYSGGMMRRLELAQALVNRPRILFLDEPSIGLDPSAKRVMWDFIKKLRSEFGTTIFLTTHDMTEADTLCDRVAIMERGRLVAVGEPAVLKSNVGGEILSITSRTPECFTKLTELGYTVISSSPDGNFDLLVSNGEKVVPQLLGVLNARGVNVEEVALKKPTLDDAFLKYTGARINQDTAWTETRRMRRSIRKLAR